MIEPGKDRRKREPPKTGTVVYVRKALATLGSMGWNRSAATDMHEIRQARIK